jgi:hypothetical protein
VGATTAAEQAAALRAYAATHAFVDTSRVAIWGWSGGGTNTLNAMFREPDVFKVGMSVAPVPDQRLYDTIYQERYMGLPQDNVAGYQLGSAINHAEGLKGRLLVVHGTGDDNVHYQGTERLINRMVTLGKRFDVMVYPNRTLDLRRDGTICTSTPCCSATGEPAGRRAWRAEDVMVWCCGTNDTGRWERMFFFRSGLRRMRGRRGGVLAPPSGPFMARLAFRCRRTSPPSGHGRHLLRSVSPSCVHRRGGRSDAGSPPVVVPEPSSLGQREDLGDSAGTPAAILAHTARINSPIRLAPAECDPCRSPQPLSQRMSCSGELPWWSAPDHAAEVVHQTPSAIGWWRAP